MGKKLVDEYLNYNSMMSNPHKVIIPIDSDRLFYESYIKSYKAVPIDGTANYKDLDYILIKNGQFSVAIEDIKFDGSSKGKGSKNDSERMSIEKNVRNHKLTENEPYSKGNTFSYDFSLETYIKRFIENFNKHYKKIHKYRQTLSDFLKNHLSSINKLGFYLHDDFYQPVLYTVKNELRVLCPLRIKEILVFLKEKCHLDFIIISHYGLKNIPQVYFLNLGKESINHLLNHTDFVTENTLFNVNKATHYYISISDSIKTDSLINVEITEPNNKG